MTRLTSHRPAEVVLKRKQRYHHHLGDHRAGGARVSTQKERAPSRVHRTRRLVAVGKIPAHPHLQKHARGMIVISLHRDPHRIFDKLENSAYHAGAVHTRSRRMYAGVGERRRRTEMVAVESAAEHLVELTDGESASILSWRINEGPHRAWTRRIEWDSMDVAMAMVRHIVSRWLARHDARAEDAAMDGGRRSCSGQVVELETHATESALCGRCLEDDKDSGPLKTSTDSAVEILCADSRQLRWRERRAILRNAVIQYSECEARGYEADRGLIPRV
ncbi:hypothetical protein C8R44DRAFT_751568 [Mycena epipterygia]|nr:hypothetical protein C8R44DRAFT_751568 [Mycena epipterygia]